MELHDAGEGNTVRSWASVLDPNALEQAKRTARSEAVAGPISLMADAHLGMGATIGSVVPTKGAIMPGCVGVDIGCGMSAIRLNRTADQLPDDLTPILSGIGQTVPSGLGKWHGDVSTKTNRWLNANPVPNGAGLETKKLGKAGVQMGTLGSGNHFLEMSIDDQGADDHGAADNAIAGRGGNVWLVVHSGSRGIGNMLAQAHIRSAKHVCEDQQRQIEDKDLAYFLESDPGYQAYIDDMLWAQKWALMNRDTMMDAAFAVAQEHLPGDEPLRIVDTVRCHHNYATLENHDGVDLWITRKGAIRARIGDRGIIPGSMGTATYLVEGLGSADSYQSASHGAGRRMSRGQARREINKKDLARQMDGRTWLSRKAEQLVDEAPDAYKDIEQVMADQSDLVSVTHRLEAIVNYKGTS